MYRTIKRLRNAQIQAVVLQFVRKDSEYLKPSKVNEATLRGQCTKWQR